MYSFSKIHHHALFEPSNYLYPIFVSLSISFAIISFTFGLHSSVFTSYDNNEINYDNNESTHEDRYKWFKANEVLDFPISQLEYKKNPKINHINFSTLNDTTSKYNLIIVDKTASVTNSDAGVNDYILKKIKHRFNLNWKVNDGYSTSDLIPPFIVSGLCENMKHSNANDHVGFLYYTGYESDLISLNNKDYYTVILRHRDSAFINDYFKSRLNYKDYVKEKKSKNITQKTSILEMLNSLKDHLTNDDELMGKHINVSIISDFINTDPTEIIPDFSEIPQINELNLYVLNGNDKKNPNSSSLLSVAKMTKNFSHQHKITTINFQEKKEAEIFYDNLSISNFQNFDSQFFDHKNDNYISFFFPFKDFDSNQEAEARIFFTENDTTQEEFQYYLKITDIDNQNNRFPIFYNIKGNKYKTTVFSEDLFPVTVHPQDILNLYLPYTSTYKNDRLFIEMSSLNANKNETRSVSFKPLLSETTSYYLLFCYTVFIVSISLILILPNLFVFFLISNKKIDCPSSSHSFVLSFPPGLGTAAVIYYYSLLLEKHLFYPLIFVLATLLLFSVPRAYFLYKIFKNGESPEFIVWRKIFILG